MPGLIILLISAFFVFLVLPRMGPMVLAIASLIALIAAGVNHYSQFYSEYKLSTWQTGLAAYAPWVTLGFALITMISSILYSVSSPETKAKVANAVTTPMELIQNKVANSASIMPSAESATNPITAAINSVIANTTTIAPSASSSSSAGAGAGAGAEGAGAGAEAVRRNNTTKSPNIPGAGFSASGI